MSFDPKRPTAFLLGRYQPFHKGHETLVRTAVDLVGQALIAVRDTYDPKDPQNPFTFAEIQQRIETTLEDIRGKIKILLLPNITNIYYGRDVGYKIEQLQLKEELLSISGTKLRELLQTGKPFNIDQMVPESDASCTKPSTP